MRYSKTHVNEILDQVFKAMRETDLGIENNNHFVKELELIREEHLLVDRRKSSLPEYTSLILHDFMERKFSYKELTEKYHCSKRTVRSLLFECAESDERVYNEIEARRH